MKRLSQGHKGWLTCALRCVCLASLVPGLNACAVSEIPQDPHAIRQTTGSLGELEPQGVRLQ